MKEMICICCPMGCHLTVDDSDLNNVIVTGNTCPRGAKYGKDEVIAPKRMVTSIVKVNNGVIAMASVKTSDAIDKAKIFESLDLLKDVTLEAPVHEGDIAYKNVLGTGIDFIVTKNVDKK